LIRIRVLADPGEASVHSVDESTVLDLQQFEAVIRVVAVAQTAEREWLMPKQLGA